MVVGHPLNENLTIFAVKVTPSTLPTPCWDLTTVQSPTTQIKTSDLFQQTPSFIPPGQRPGTTSTSSSNCHPQPYRTCMNYITCYDYQILVA